MSPFALIGAADYFARWQMEAIRGARNTLRVGLTGEYHSFLEIDEISE